ncbi:hypothetical protein Mesci_3808 [Mesorhizobium ciceri biovar biserrulae WSM1271]|uniref:Uncharacterized protein n=1 Tax=Mesorhizobium ciceri biovar biserrulae (strain HAMBI 2942 / LMG 23838 / WSM1271) TaxID=765698 RepID=E8T7S4_MESCW|nr:hypothetical protein Mesci_3808 [Mesorhizobium ciceri biovar biserrulae WSM1271]
MLRAFLVGLSLVTGMSAAYAADLTLECAVTRSRDDGTQRSYKLRYNITWDTRAVRIYQDNGTGWSFVRDIKLADANNDEIVLENTDTWYTAIDRSTGKIASIKTKQTGS